MKDFIGKMARKFEDGAKDRADRGKPSGHDVLTQAVDRQDKFDKQAEADRKRRDQ